MFHKSEFGHFGDNLPCDLNGFVPEPGDSPDGFVWDHDDFTEDFDKDGNGYAGYAKETWEDFVRFADSKTHHATVRISGWRETNP